MFFLVRCAFWLSVVFSALPWQDGGLDLSVGALKQEAEKAASAGVAHAIERATDHCLQKPEDCSDVVTQVQKVIGGKTIGDTLKGSDLAPAWRGKVAGRS